MSFWENFQISSEKYFMGRCRNRLLAVKQGKHKSSNVLFVCSKLTNWTWFMQNHSMWKPNQIWFRLRSTCQGLLKANDVFSVGGVSNQLIFSLLRFVKSNIIRSNFHIRCLEIMCQFSIWMGLFNECEKSEDIWWGRCLGGESLQVSELLMLLACCWLYQHVINSFNCN